MSPPCILRLAPRCYNHQFSIFVYINHTLGEDEQASGIIGHAGQLYICTYTFARIIEFY